MVFLGQDMEKSRVDHRKKIENIKQKHQLDLKNKAHEVDLRLEVAKGTSDLGN